jgi:hypothetical protein
MNYHNVSPAINTERNIEESSSAPIFNEQLMHQIPNTFLLLSKPGFLIQSPESRDYN